MEEILFENELYYFDNGKLYDENFIETPNITSRQVLTHYYNSIDYKSFNEENLINFLKQLKTSEFYEACLKIIDYGLNKFAHSLNLRRRIIAMKLSCHRALNQPQKAIEYWNDNQDIFSSCISVPLLTSLAAAYCDVKNYELARKYANKAYALQGGSLNYTSELSLVYQRIKKETQNN
jgi:tetratricopeptide (TPR) repeat protein